MSKKIVDSEAYEQTKLAVWLNKQGIRFYASANGGSRNLFEAIKMKKIGVSAGVPDICLPIPNNNYHGLYIEMKRVKGGVVSDVQKDWISFLRSQGYMAEIAKGFEEAKEIVSKYLTLTPYAA